MIQNVLRKLTEYMWLFALPNSVGMVARRSCHVMLQVSKAVASAIASAVIPIMSPSSQKNKEQMTPGVHAQISYHQTRGCYVQRSKHGFCPGGRLRSLL